MSILLTFHCVRSFRFESLFFIYSEIFTERGGFEPPVPFGYARLPSVYLKPLGHLSKVYKKSSPFWRATEWDWHDSNVRPPPPQGDALIQLSYSLKKNKQLSLFTKRRRQELNLPSPFGTDGLAIRCITALPHLQGKSRSERDSNPRTLSDQ